MHGLHLMEASQAVVGDLTFTSVDGLLVYDLRGEMLESARRKNLWVLQVSPLEYAHSLHFLPSAGLTK
jgi:hypothetical protein